MRFFLFFFFSAESIHQPLPFKVGRNPYFPNFFFCLRNFTLKGSKEMRQYQWNTFFLMKDIILCMILIKITNQRVKTL